MSLETWKAEFYPTAADSPEANADPIGHSLRKWEGLVDQSMAKHGVCKADGNGEGLSITDGNGEFGAASWQSCSLCRTHYDSGLDPEPCLLCPIYKMTKRDCLVAYSMFQMRDNPLPMIDLLCQTKEWDLKQKEAQ